MKYTDEQLIAFLADELDDDSKSEISAWIETSDAAQKRIAELQALEQLFTESLSYEPPAEMLYSFREKIIAEREKATGRFRWYQAAAAIVLMAAGFGAGRLTLDSNKPSPELSGLQQEVRMLQQVVMMNTLRNHTASERLQAIDTIEESTTPPDTGLILTLLQTMNNDESPNVRTAAVEVLGRYLDREVVRMEMVHSLGEQDNPLVQIAMINLLARAEEKTAIAPIKKIADNEDSLPVVRHTAEIALNMLI